MDTAQTKPTPITQLTELTPEMRAAMAPHAQMWIKRALECRPADREVAERGIRAHYRIAGHAEPQRIVWVDSPFTVSLAGTIASVLIDVSLTDEQVSAVVKDALGPKRAKWLEPVTAAVFGAIAGERGERDVTHEALVEEARAEIRRSWHLRCGGHLWSAWPASYGTFYRDVCGLDIAPEALRAAEDVTECGWWWPHERYVIVGDRPTALHRDEEGRVHCETGPAMAWGPAEELHYWHGVRVPREWIEAPETVDAAEVLRSTDTEQRRAGCEAIGWGRIMALCPHTVIDRDEDPMVGTMYRVELPDDAGGLLVEALCGTGRTVYYWAHPESTSAVDAAARSYGVSVEVYRKLERRT